MMTSLTDDPWWLPARILLSREGAHTVQWRNTEGVRCTHSFYSGTMTTVAAGPRCTTALKELELLAERLPAGNPDGFIFHLSRCGSTLVSQMLAALPRYKVLSEPAPLDNILWPEEAAARPEDNRCAELLERLVRVLGRRPEGTEAVL